MQHSKDFLEREIQKLSLLLNSLLNELSGIKPEEQDKTLEEINTALKAEFRISIKDISNLDQAELITKLKKIHHTNLDKMVELYYLMIQNSEESRFQKLLSKPKTIDNIIFLLDYAEKQSSIFSYERMNLKTALRELKA
ncbi:hypothetical protein [Salegentibacter maritimus]|uniref:Uncharacterized protein n=1 Tax=Salegentibacter maritimus TaxID=2794347 RepID=A0ABS0TEB7_9FLAO|nr:hypothetical protein [Salegentibacter maritimus]MBI6119312.1 hypothetical protein [Salegentibacter maritimus]